MIGKDIIKIINEEASNFDFLGNEDYLKEREIKKTQYKFGL